MIDYEENDYRAILQKMSNEELETEIEELQASIKRLESVECKLGLAVTTWAIRSAMKRLGIAKFELKRK